jgi:hypothetical protein
MPYLIKMNNNQAKFPLKKDNAVLDYLQIGGKLYTISEIEKEIIDLEESIKNEKGKIRDTEEKLILEKTSLRENSLQKQFDMFISRQSEVVKKSVYLNKSLLHCVVKSYYDDIHRYKDYSGSKWANNHKQAAYTIKWIVKFKPVQIKEEFDNDKLNDEIIDINSTFALVCAFSLLDRNIIDLISEEKRKIDRGNLKEKKKQSFYNKLLYTLRFRPFTGKQLISIFEALELNVNN